MNLALDDQTTTAAPAAGRSAPADVLLIISHLGHGGAQRVVCNLANALSRDGYRVSVLLTKRRSNNALELDPAVEVQFLVYDPPAWSIAHLAGLYRLSQWLPKLRAAIKNSGAPRVVSFIRPTNVKVLIACLGLKDQRLVICERNDPLRQPLGWHWMLLTRLLYPTADLVAINSHGIRRSLASFVKDSKLIYLPNLLAIPEPKRVEKLTAPTILAVGRIVHQKGYDILIRAFEKAGAELADWRIVFLGEGPEEKNLRDLAQSLGVAERIEWRGHVADPFAFYRAADIFVLTSRYEGMPNALLEAMSCGLPAIVSDASPGPLELIDHEKNGLVIAAENVSETAAALVRLANDEAERERLGSAARGIGSRFQPVAALGAWKEALGLVPQTKGRTAIGARGEHGGSRTYLLVRQISHYAIRPKIWPDLARWLTKRIKDRVVGKDETAEQARRAMAAGTAWCAERAQSPTAALASLGIETPICDLREHFSKELTAAEARVETVPFRLGGASNLDLIYTLCEAVQATRVIETGVANGWSSLAILLSISTRPGAVLHSVDLPYLKYQNDPWVGIAVPESLRHGWTLHRMADREGLPKALEALDSIDIAHYDSDKSIEGRRFAYRLLWRALRPGGLLFSDDINDNFGFRDFCDSIGQEPVIVRQGNKFQGILRKPD